MDWRDVQVVSDEGLKLPQVNRAAAPDRSAPADPGARPSPASPLDVGAERMDAVARLAGVVAHDFNNLLTVIIGHAEILLDAVDPSDTVRRDALEIKNAADAAARISDQLLAISRSQAIMAHPVDLNELVRGLVETLQQIAGHGVDLWFDFDANLPLAEIDERRIERVIRTLVASARDAVKGRGRIKLATRGSETPERREVLLIVSDSRGTMTDEACARACEPVLDVAKLGRGTSLALAAAYGMVAQSGGSLRFEHDADGARAVLALPVPPDPQPRLRW
jgi:two-component system cell cycle sensor histidine kinase/response regulator CckA